MEDLGPLLIYIIVPGLVAGFAVVVTRRLSARVFWLGLGVAFATCTALAALAQIGKEQMNGPLSTALLVFIIPAVLAMSVGRSVRKWSLPAVIASLLTYAVALEFNFSLGINIRWLGK